MVDGARYSAADMAAQWAPPAREGRGLRWPGRRAGATPEAARAADGAAGADPAGRAAGTGAARMHRWVLDPATGRVSEGPLDDRPIEFPTVDPDRVGRAARYRYGATSTPGRNAIVKMDLHAGTTTAHELGPEVKPGEAVFVPSERPGRGEDEGWLLTIATRADGSASRLLVLDATDVARTVAAVVLPRGVPRVSTAPGSRSRPRPRDEA